MILALCNNRLIKWICVFRFCRRDLAENENEREISRWHNQKCIYEIMDVCRRLMEKPFTSKESDYVGNEKINVKAHAQYTLNKRWQINTLEFGYPHTHTRIISYLFTLFGSRVYIYIHLRRYRLHLCHPLVRFWSSFKQDAQMNLSYMQKMGLL